MRSARVIVSMPPPPLGTDPNPHEELFVRHCPASIGTRDDSWIGRGRRLLGIWPMPGKRPSPIVPGRSRDGSTIARRRAWLARRRSAGGRPRPNSAPGKRRPPRSGVAVASVIVPASGRRAASNVRGRTRAATRSPACTTRAVVADEHVHWLLPSVTARPRRPQSLPGHLTAVLPGSWIGSAAVAVESAAPTAPAASGSWETASTGHGASRITASATLPRMK
jgi:hypothetical protein